MTTVKETGRAPLGAGSIRLGPPQRRPCPLEDFWASFRVATQRSLVEEDLVGQAEDIGERGSDK